MGETCKRG
ncbi:stromal cell-derived factor 2 precursor, partial [Danaus plexippus plexippus]